MPVCNGFVRFIFGATPADLLMASMAAEPFWSHILAHINTTSLNIITARKRSLGQGNIFTPVCHSVHRGVCLSACWDTTPQTRHSPRPGTTSPDQAPPPRPGTPPTRHIPPGAGIPPGVDPPRRACWEIRSTCGHYASWNAILFSESFTRWFGCEVERAMSSPPPLSAKKFKWIDFSS